MKLLAELDTGKGVGLIERIKQGQGKPTKIYVKRFTTRAVPPPAPPEPDSFMPIPEVDFSDVQKSEKPTSRGRRSRLAEVGKSDSIFASHGGTQNAESTEVGPEAESKAGFDARLVLIPLGAVFLGGAGYGGWRLMKYLRDKKRGYVK